MAASAPRYLARQVAAVSQLLPVRAQRPSARQSPAWRSGRGACQMRRSITLEPDKSHDLLLRAYALEAEFTADSMASALDSLRQALALDPTYATAMAAAAYCHAQCHFQGWAPPDSDHRAEGTTLAWKSVEL